MIGSLRAALDRVQEVGGARPGDRTMIDALAPALDASRTAWPPQPRPRVPATSPPPISSATTIRAPKRWPGYSST